MDKGKTIGTIFGIIGTFLVLCSLSLFFIASFIKDQSIFYFSIIILIFGIFLIILTSILFKDNNKNNNQEPKINVLWVFFRTVTDFIGIILTVFGSIIFGSGLGGFLYCLKDSCSESWSFPILIAGWFVLVIGVAFLSPLLKDIYIKKKSIVIFIAISIILAISLIAVLVFNNGPHF